MDHIALASKIRLIMAEPFLAGVNRQKAVEALYLEKCGDGRNLWHWVGWYKGGVLQNIYEAERELGKVGITRYSIKKTILQKHPKRANTAGTKGLVQSTCINLLKEKIPNDHATFRRRLARWDLGGSPRIYTEKAMWAVREAWRLLPPRTASVVLSSLLNRWTTDRRFQTRNRCRLRGAEGTEDSLGHIPFCGRVQKVAGKLFNLPRAGEARDVQEHRRRFSAWKIGMRGHH